MYQGIHIRHVADSNSGSEKQLRTFGLDIWIENLLPQFSMYTYFN